MCFKKCIYAFYFVMIAMLLSGVSFNCVMGPVESKTVSVSLPAEMATFTTDSAGCWNVYQQHCNGGSVGLSKISKAQALLAFNPDRIEVMSVVSKHSAVVGEPGQDFYMTFWQAHNNQYNRWENQVQFYRENPNEDLLGVSELKRDGNYAKGSVVVAAKGETSVMVGFIMPGDTLYSTSYWASYVAGDSVKADGWYLNTYTQRSPIDTVRFP